MQLHIDFNKLDGYGILVSNLLAAIGQHDEKEIKMMCQFIIRMADSHIKEDKLVREVENENANLGRSKTVSDAMSSSGLSISK